MEAFCRGLIIDKSEGNIIKVDRHKYVRKVFHGKRELDSVEKKAIYGSHVVSFTERNYVNIDTLFLLIDALLFTSLVDLSDKNPTLINKSYEEIYKVNIYQSFSFHAIKSNVFTISFFDLVSFQ